MSININDEELQRLLQIKKFLPVKFKIPFDIDTESFPLRTEGKEDFQLYIQRKNTIELRKSKTQTSYFKEPLVRLEVDCPEHTNPDGEIIGRNHIHIYCKGYRMRWAFPLEDFHKTLFKNPYDYYQLFVEFCDYVNIDSKGLQGVISCYPE